MSSKKVIARRAGYNNWWSVIAVLAVIFGFWFYQTRRDFDTELMANAMSYQKNAKAPRWWLKDVPQSATEMAKADKDAARLASEFADRVASLANSVAAPADLREIRKVFAGKPVISMFNGKAAVYVGISLSSLKLPKPALEVCFIPYAYRDAEGNTPPVQYNREWHALVLTAVERPAPVDDGIIVHEVVHALRHKQGKASAIADPDSDAYISEELEAHDLECWVFDHKSGDAYSNAAWKLVKRENASSFRQVCASVTATDLRKMDGVLTACQPGSAVEIDKETAGQLVMQHLLTVGEYWINENELEERRPAEKIKLYRWMRDTLTKEDKIG